MNEEGADMGRPVLHFEIVGKDGEDAPQVLRPPLRLEVRR
jgi:hypothetical protein